MDQNLDVKARTLPCGLHPVQILSSASSMKTNGPMLLLWNWPSHIDFCDCLNYNAVAAIWNQVASKSQLVVDEHPKIIFWKFEENLLRGAWDIMLTTDIWTDEWVKTLRVGT